IRFHVVSYLHQASDYMIVLNITAERNNLKYKPQPVTINGKHFFQKTASGQRSGAILGWFT
ncbi:hypothetical protein N9V90_01690, partial [Endozoicomonas sp.]|nr:hypothetical protein [Endozoicomonas sp.]